MKNHIMWQLMITLMVMILCNDRINKHIIERKDDFITIEEPKDLTKVVKANKTYLIDCVSMWLLNNLEKKKNF
jgi:adenosylcobinamide kinase/adenosylcobinamide-phosphate guanylyltransferase